MTRSVRSPAWLLMCVLVACVACGGARCDGMRGEAPSAVAKVALPRPDLRLLVLTDPRGYLEPCGCNQRPLGGLDKLATVVAGARRDGVPTLLLGAGDIAFGSELHPEDAAQAATQERLRAETFVSAWKQIGVQAVVPGPLDLGQPREILRGLVERGGFAWLADNARGAKEESPLTSARVLDVEGVKVGVLGVVAPTPGLAESGLELAPEISTIVRDKSAALRSEGARLVVALVTGERRLARSLAGKGPDVVVMGGLDLEQPLPPATHEGTLLLHAGRQGQLVVTADLSLKDGRGAWEDASEWTAREVQKELEREIRELREKIAGWEKDPSIARGDLELQKSRLGELERTRATARTPTLTGRWFSAAAIELSPEVAGDPQIGAQLDAHDKRVNEHNRVSLAGLVPKPPAVGAPSYAGSDSCASCHEAAYKWWRGTKHGRAYATLEKVDKQFNLNCVSCHVVGYNQPGGSTVTHVDALKDVGCESCHGPGSLHNAKPEQPGLVQRGVDEALCKSCHTPEHSDRFVYDAFKAMLIVPGHGLPLDRR